MKNFKYFLFVVTITLITTSCGLFRGGGGGGHCPAYGTSINDEIHNDVNNADELTERFSERM